MKAAVLLAGPLVLLIAVAIAIFGTDGPSGDNAVEQAAFRTLGMVYGIYLIGLSIAWSRRRK